MSNKTVVQELLEWLDTEDYNLSEFECYILNHRKELLEKERQQIMEAYHNGQVIVFNLLKKAFPNYKFPLTQNEVDKIECGLDVNEDAEYYYIEKYNNDTKRQSR